MKRLKVKKCPSMSLFIPIKTVENELERLKGHGLTLISIFFIIFGSLQIVSLLIFTSHSIVTSTGETKALFLNPIRVILVVGFSALLISSGIGLWYRKDWGWILSVLSSIGIVSFGFYELYLFLNISSTIFFGIVYILLGCLILSYLGQDSTRKKLKK